MKIFIGFSEVAGFYSTLSEGLVESGHTVCFRSFGPNPFNYSIEACPSSFQRLLWLSTKLYHKAPLFLKLPAYLLHLFLRVCTIFPFMLYSDLILINYSGTLFCYVDVLLLRLLGKRVIYIFHGSDARAPYFNGKYIYPTFSLSRLRRLTFIASLRIRIIQGLGCICMAPPAISHFFSKPIINLSLIGLPWPKPMAPAHRQSSSSKLSEQFTILHAPSNNINKGTAQIRDVIQKLRDTHTNINYIEISGQSNSAVLDAIANADLVIDELWSDARLAGLGCEAAACHVPTLIGTHYTDNQWRTDTHNANSFVITTPPHQLEECISNLISNRLILDQIKSDLASAQSQYSPNQYSSRILDVLLSSPTHLGFSNYWYDPLKCSYLYGWGAPSHVVSHVVREFVGKYGLKSLCLPSKSRSLALIKELILSDSASHDYSF